MSVMIDTIAKKRAWIKEIVRDIAAAFCGSIVIAMAAPLSYQLPFTLIPLSIQPHVALLVAFLLGKRGGPIAVAMFIAQGAMGAPIFSGGAFGLANLLGPRGGYLAGYFMAAIFIGNYKPTTYVKTFLLFTGANAIIYLFGAFWLSSFIGPLKSLSLGVLPFLLGDAIKLLIITKVAMLSSFNSTFQRKF